MKRVFLLLVMLIFVSQGLRSMNVKSLEITWENVSLLTYRGNAIFYLYDPSPIDSAITFYWGDDTWSVLVPSLIEDIPGELKRVTFSGVHTYSGPSTFTMFVSYKVRSLGVINVPNSLVTDIYAEAMLVVSPFLPGLKSPVFLDPPRLNVCRGSSNDMNLMAWDASGDQLVYSVIPCRGEMGDPIAGYTYPSSSVSFSIDPQSGMLVWNSPLERGFFNYAVKVEKYRNGILLGSVMRDALVNVLECSVSMPVLDAMGDTCILAGQQLRDTIVATYSGNDTITLTASGEPLLLTADPALFPQPIRDRDTASSVFVWDATCVHVRPEPYHMIFRAEVEDSLSTLNNTYTFESGYSPFLANPSPEIGQPCQPGWDGSNYLWFGSDSTAPRSLVTPVLDLSAGNYMMVFDMRFADHTGNPNTTCEGPDEPDEGIYLQYSISGVNGPWVPIAYWDPSISPGEGGHVSNLIGWNNYSVVVPEAAISPGTRIRWVQFEATGSYYDHWGLDNITVYKISDHKPAVSSADITVIAPAPENLTATPVSDDIFLQWNKEYCSEAQGYLIYRKAGPSGYLPSNCETGVPLYTGYMLIDSLFSIDDTTYTDNNYGLGLPHGNEYCYMVTAWFSNGAESQASNEACAQLIDDEPVITHVDVRVTSTSAGQIFVDWTVPDDFDTLAYPGPFRYDIYRAPDFQGGSYVLAGTSTGLTDTTFLDTGINTSDGPWHYRVDLLYANGGSVYNNYSSSFPASSVYLDIAPYDQRLVLNWEYSVPWINDSTVVYRFNPGTLLWDSIGTSYTTHFVDSGLVNGVQYCYKVETIGKYSLPDMPVPLRNFSQERCEAPMDVEPPCPVYLMVNVNCDDVSNELTWTNPASICGDGDVGYYEVYYSPMTDGELTMLGTVDNPADTFFTHVGVTSVAGCYAIAAVDTVGNVSQLSNVVCVDIDACDLYELPNVFTPNGDGVNDYFIPFPYDFVEKIDITIFDRWGLAMFSTQDPDIMWDGRNQTSGNECSEGVYFYVCDVYELRLSGIRKRTLTGTVHLYRNQ